MLSMHFGSFSIHVTRLVWLCSLKLRPPSTLQEEGGSGEYNTTFLYLRGNSPDPPFLFGGGSGYETSGYVDCKCGAKHLILIRTLGNNNC